MARPFWTGSAGVCGTGPGCGGGARWAGPVAQPGGVAEALGGAIQGVATGRGQMGGALWSGAGLRQKRAGLGLQADRVLDAPRAASGKLLSSE